ncbi:carbon monoxide dehydrogenase small chain CoxS (plasmid) [Dinoroseobacter shibae DFL 12 = DSM 16493]|jgi:carbon-monoxide dehydrogenase small subunit|uniref:Carbon monoxide dehydrogenase small chain CoxS n=2 Tax=Dinoroseobacter shibae TaxID=215813 RepID=A8LUJ4_DINSH|nr:(2Fe-2S)-binding protein [Dinoroseobacter shibae]ABV95911.1 carbon monoxide dehydrogenase small chain CoxS [Dinoroseobacter shibae DFL 12 = DSM 16493]URF49153.1 (2Fe-2S)-binding protein [Dinoroseobacter shibae]URF53461.1 (2Fe-2S)-binding protein [Dinoroseobacter shibae]
MTEMFRDKIDVEITVNGEPVEARVPAGQHLIDFLRQTVGLTGAHASCEHGVCGACTVEVDGASVRGCLMLAAQADGAEVWTVEGLTERGRIADLQAAFIAHNALQCGFCTPGMLVACDELLRRGGTPSRAEIREHLSGNYCRCTGYEAIVDAVETVAKARAGKGAA